MHYNRFRIAEKIQFVLALQDRHKKDLCVQQETEEFFFLSLNKIISYFKEQVDNTLDNMVICLQTTEFYTCRN